MADHGYDRTTGSNMANFAFLQLHLKEDDSRVKLDMATWQDAPNQVERSLGNFIEVPAGMLRQ